MNLAVPTWIAGLLTCGMGVAVLGSVKVALSRRLEIDEARVGGLVSMFGFAMIPVMLLIAVGAGVGLLATAVALHVAV